MAIGKLYFSPSRNLISALSSPDSREIVKADVAALVAKGAEVDQSARDLNVKLKAQERG